MFPGFDKIVEERIRKAQLRGEFDNLPGRGEPLVVEDNSGVPEDLRMAYKILKNADCLPPEIEAKKEIASTEALLTAVDDAAEKYRLLKRLNFLIMKINTLRSTSIRFEEPQRYSQKMIARLSAGGDAAGSGKQHR